MQQLLVERYPQLAAPPTDSLLELDTPLPSPPSSIEWHPSCNLVPLQQDASEENAFKPQDEDKLEPKHPITWHDIALSIGAELMFKARNEILQTLGYTTSAVSITRL